MKRPKRVSIVFVALLVVIVAVGISATGATASAASKHRPNRPYCARSTRNQAVAAITATWDTLLNGKRALTSDQRFAVVDGSDDPTFRATLDDLVAANTALLEAATVRVGRVTCTAKRSADVDYILHIDGAPGAALARTGTAVLVGRQWKVSKPTVCDLFTPGDPSLSQRGPCAL